MSAVLAVAWREVRERRFILAAALAFSLLALGLHLAPSPRVRGVGDSLALLFFMAFPVGAALAVGSSLVARDLAEGRLSFYFSRPFSTAAIWAGKLLGGAALVLGAFLLCSVPTLSIGGLSPWAAAFWTLFLLALMGVAHVAATMYRSGSRLLVLDLLLGATLVAALAALLRWLLDAGAGRFVVHVLGPLGAGLAIVVTASAAAAQLAYGRTDAGRSHRALSVVVWSLGFCVLGALVLHASWLLDVSPRDVGGAGFPVQAAPRGSAVFFQGFSEEGRVGYNPGFLFDGESGTYVRVPSQRMTWPAFSADGKRAVWVAAGGPWGWGMEPGSGSFLSHLGDPRTRLDARLGIALDVARLDGGLSVEELPLGLPDLATGVLAVDEGGRRALVTSRSAVFLMDVADGTLVSQLPVPDALAADFLPDGAVRLYRKEAEGSGRTALVVQHWTPRDGARAERARVPLDGFPLLLRRGDLSVVTMGRHGRALVDASKGTVRRLDSTVTDRPGVSHILASGRLALSFPDEVRVVTLEGALVVSIPIESGLSVYALREPTPGELAIGLWSQHFDRLRTLFVDAETGTVRREEKGLVPAGPIHLAAPQPEPGSLASRLLTDLKGSLVVFEPDGRRRELVSGRR